jgi:hypothetical protein
MLGQEVSRLLKGTYFAKNELTVVSLESETNQFRLLQSLADFLEKSLCEKKTVQVVDLSENVESFLDAETDFTKQIEIL